MLDIESMISARREWGGGGGGGRGRLKHERVIVSQLRRGGGGGGPEACSPGKMWVLVTLRYSGGGFKINKVYIVKIQTFSA